MIKNQGETHSEGKNKRKEIPSGRKSEGNSFLWKEIGRNFLPISFRFPSDRKEIPSTGRKWKENFLPSEFPLAFSYLMWHILIFNK